MGNTIRKARVSGSFYPFEPSDILELMNQMTEREKSKIDYSLADRKILAAILPHAGHIYSGYQTLHFFEILKQSGQVFDLWVIIHPLHHGSDMDYAVEGSDYWNTPLGNVRVDKEFVKALGIPVSTEIHRFEHSSEVILPFIQKYNENEFSFVSIGISKQNPETADEISRKLINAIKSSPKNICIIASSDFSHYVNPEHGRAMDQKVINKILQKEVRGIYKEIIESDLSVCGYGPIMVLCETLNTLYPEAVPVVLARGHSGEIHPSSSVVDYISFMFYIDK